MTHRIHADDRDGAAAKFYAPVGITPSFDTNRVERLWATLFDHRVHPPE